MKKKDLYVGERKKFLKVITVCIAFIKLVLLFDFIKVVFLFSMLVSSKYTMFSDRKQFDSVFCFVFFPLFFSFYLIKVLFVSIVCFSMANDFCLSALVKKGLARAKLLKINANIHHQ